MNMLSKMIALAANAHADQTDKAGKAYILHPLKVMHYLKTEDEELMCMAVGHDLFEDTDITRVLLLELGFSLRVVDGISCVTRQRGEAYEEYKSKVKSNKDAIRVKMADLRHNSDLRRLKGVTEKDVARTARYMQFYKELEELL